MGEWAGWGSGGGVGGSGDSLNASLWSHSITGANSLGQAADGTAQTNQALQRLASCVLLSMANEAAERQRWLPHSPQPLPHQMALMTATVPQDNVKLFVLRRALEATG